MENRMGNGFVGRNEDENIDETNISFKFYSISEHRFVFSISINKI